MRSDLSPTLGSDPRSSRRDPRRREWRSISASSSYPPPGSGRGLNAAWRLLSQNQAFRSTSSISSRNISKVSHCSSAAASSSPATASACVVAPNRPGSRAYRSRSARTAFSPAICVCNSPILAVLLLQRHPWSLPAQFVPRMRIARHLHAQRVNGSVRAAQQCP